MTSKVLLLRFKTVCCIIPGSCDASVSFVVFLIFCLCVFSYLMITFLQPSLQHIFYFSLHLCWVAKKTYTAARQTTLTVSIWLPQWFITCHVLWDTTHTRAHPHVHTHIHTPCLPAFFFLDTPTHTHTFVRPRHSKRLPRIHWLDKGKSKSSLANLNSPEHTVLTTPN